MCNKYTTKLMWNLGPINKYASSKNTSKMDSMDDFQLKLEWPSFTTNVLQFIWGPCENQLLWWEMLVTMWWFYWLGKSVELSTRVERWFITCWTGFFVKQQLFHLQQKATPKKRGFFRWTTHNTINSWVDICQEEILEWIFAAKRDAKETEILYNQ